MPVTDCGFNDHPNVLMHYGPTLYIELGFNPSKTKTPRISVPRRFVMAFGVYR